MVMAGPRRHHLARDYLLFSGDLRGASPMGHRWTPSWFTGSHRTCSGPRTGRGCVASEIDFDSILLGGSAKLIDAVLAEPGLETCRVCSP